MYARQLLVPVKMEHRQSLENIGKRWLAAVATLPGFIHVTFVFDEKAEECGYFSVWENREYAEAVPDLVGPNLQETLREYIKGPIRVRYFNVYSPGAS